MTTQIDESFFLTSAQIVWKKGLPETFEIASSGGVLQTEEGPQEYKPGDYIITGAKGERYSMSESAFMELKRDVGSNIAIPKKIPKLAKLASTSGTLKTKNGHTLEYKEGEDYIVRHKSGDYGVIRADIFRITYEPLGRTSAKAPSGLGESLQSTQDPKPLTRPSAPQSSLRQGRRLKAV